MSSDDDDDGDGGPKKKKPASASTSGKKKGRSKQCPGCGAVLPLATKECLHCDYQFTSKSMLVSVQSAAEESQSIREKFPFEPERVRLV
jgi:predicted amidophosphoribosyltransferase